MGQPGRLGRAALAAAVAASTVMTLGVAGAPAQAQEPASPRQLAFQAAAAEFGVPQSVLLGVSYLQSRWDFNAGTPSTTGGYGPMHLTDAAPWLADGAHHDRAEEDPRGDESRPLPRVEAQPGELPESLRTLPTTADLTGLDEAALRSDPHQNIRGGAALLASYQQALGAPRSSDPADWYGAVARYSGATDTSAARRFADEVYEQIRVGADRITDDGQRVVLAATDVAPDTSWLGRLGLPPGERTDAVECPAGLDCEWIPAPYVQYGATVRNYGNHDKSDRPARQKVEYIVIHDTEGSYAGTLRMVQDPTYVSWHYTLRSSDGHIAQHVPTKDVAWHAGNWFVNAKAVGLEHEGFAASGTWYTEAMYRTSAELVRHLAQLHDIPLDRAHIIGHDNVSGTIPSTVRGMHWDPGPYWNWSHYFDLLGAPFEPVGGPGAELVTIRPDFDTNRPAFYGCDPAVPTALCPSRGSSSVILHSAPSPNAPLLNDIALRPDGTPNTMRISDHGSRASTGQRYAVAEVRGDWTAIWYLGQKGWFHNPPDNPSAVSASGLVITPRPGLASIPVYGRAYPEASAFPADVPVQTVTPLQYTLRAGERYAVGQSLGSEYYRAVTVDGSSPGDWTVIRGQDRYYQIQFGHRAMYVKASDVTVRQSFYGSPL